MAAAEADLQAKAGRGAGLAAGVPLVLREACEVVISAADRVVGVPARAGRGRG